MKEKMDHIEESVHGLRDQIEELEGRVIRLERTTYMLLGGLILLQALPMLSDYMAL